MVAITLRQYIFQLQPTNSIFFCKNISHVYDFILYFLFSLKHKQLKSSFSVMYVCMHFMTMNKSSHPYYLTIIIIFKENLSAAERQELLYFILFFCLHDYMSQCGIYTFSRLVTFNLLVVPPQIYKVILHTSLRGHDQTILGKLLSL